MKIKFKLNFINRLNLQYKKYFLFANFSSTNNIKEELDSLLNSEHEQDSHLEFILKKNENYQTKFDDPNFLLPADKTISKLFKNNNIDYYMKKDISNIDEKLFKEKTNISNDKANPDSDFKWRKLSDQPESPWYYKRMRKILYFFTLLTIGNYFLDSFDLMTSKYLNYNRWKYLFV